MMRGLARQATERDASFLFQQFRQLGDIHRDPPRLVRMYAGRGFKKERGRPPLDGLWDSKSPIPPEWSQYGAIVSTKCCLGKGEKGLRRDFSLHCAVTATGTQQAAW